MDRRIDLVIDGMGCDHCVSSVRKALEGVQGVEVERVEVGSASVRLPDGSGPEAEAVLEAIRGAGFSPALAGGTEGG